MDQLSADSPITTRNERNTAPAASSRSTLKTSISAAALPHARVQRLNGMQKRTSAATWADDLGGETD